MDGTGLRGIVLEVHGHAHDLLLALDFVEGRALSGADMKSANLVRAVTRVGDDIKNLICDPLLVGCGMIDGLHLAGFEGAVGEARHRLGIQSIGHAGAHGVHDFGGLGRVAQHVKLLAREATTRDGRIEAPDLLHGEVGVQQALDSRLFHALGERHGDDVHVVGGVSAVRVFLQGVHGDIGLEGVTHDLHLA